MTFDEDINFDGESIIRDVNEIFFDISTKNAQTATLYPREKRVLYTTAEGRIVGGRMISADSYALIVTRIEIMSGVDMGRISSGPQEGKIYLRLSDQHNEYNVSSKITSEGKQVTVTRTS